VPVLAATEKLTVPLPVPDAPEVMLIGEEAAVVAVHAQLGEDGVTPTEPVPPPMGRRVEVALRV
jgi:hypothetical protein